MSEDLLRSPLFREIFKDAYREQIPLIVHAELTNGCNQRCRHCYVDEEKKEMLPLREWVSLLDQLVRLKTLILTLSGGEPLLHPEFAEIYGEAHARRFGIRLFTNGLLLDDSLLKLMDARKPLNVQLSLYGHTPEIHDGITGVHGAFERTVAAVRSVVALNIPVHIKCLWMKPNAYFFHAIRDFARSLGAEFFGSTMLTASRSENSANLDYRLDLDQLKYIMKAGEKMSAAKRSDSLEEKLPPADGEDVLCGAGFITMRIAAEGKVYPCVEYEQEAGDVRKNSLEEIWRQSPILGGLRRLRKKDAAVCSSCELVADCFRCPAQALKEGGDVLACYREAYRQARTGRLLREESNERTL